MDKEKLFRIWGRIACGILFLIWCEKVYLLIAELNFSLTLLYNPFFWIYVFVQSLIYGTPMVPIFYFSFIKNRNKNN